MTGNYDPYSCNTANLNRNATDSQRSCDFCADSGGRVSKVSVFGRINERTLFARRYVVCVPFTCANKSVRLEQCRDHIDYRTDECVTFPLLMNLYSV